MTNVTKVQKMLSFDVGNGIDMVQAFISTSQCFQGAGKTGNNILLNNCGIGDFYTEQLLVSHVAVYDQIGTSWFDSHLLCLWFVV